MKFVNHNRFLESLTYYQMMEFSTQLTYQMRFDVMPDFDSGVLSTEYNHFIELQNPTVYLMVEAEYRREIVRNGLYPSLTDVEQKIRSIRIFETRQDQYFHMALLELENSQPEKEQVFRFN